MLAAALDEVAIGLEPKPINPNGGCYLILEVSPLKLAWPHWGDIDELRLDLIRQRG